MTRLFFVLPVYLIAIFWLPETPAYEAFHAAVIQNGVQAWHLTAYAVGLTLGVVGALVIEFGFKPIGFGFDSVLRVLRLGFMGLIVTCAYQFFAYYTGRELSVFILLMPVLFIVAETFYEIAEYLIYLTQARRRRSEYDAPPD